MHCASSRTNLQPRGYALAHVASQADLGVQGAGAEPGDLTFQSTGFCKLDKLAAMLCSCGVVSTIAVPLKAMGLLSRLWPMTSLQTERILCFCMTYESPAAAAAAALLLGANKQCNPADAAATGQACS